MGYAQPKNQCYGKRAENEEWVLLDEQPNEWAFSPRERMKQWERDENTRSMRHDPISIMQNSVCLEEYKWEERTRWLSIEKKKTALTQEKWEKEKRMQIDWKCQM